MNEINIIRERIVSKVIDEVLKRPGRISRLLSKLVNRPSDDELIRKILHKELASNTPSWIVGHFAHEFVLRNPTVAQKMMNESENAILTQHEFAVSHMADIVYETTSEAA